MAPQQPGRARVQCLRTLLQAAQCLAAADDEEGGHTDEEAQAQGADAHEADG